MSDNEVNKKELLTVLSKHKVKSIESVIVILLGMGFDKEDLKKLAEALIEYNKNTNGKI